MYVMRVCVWMASLGVCAGLSMRTSLARSMLQVVPYIRRKILHQNTLAQSNEFRSRRVPRCGKSRQSVFLCMRVSTHSDV